MCCFRCGTGSKSSGLSPQKPLVLGGNDSYQNLIIVSDVVHILIHSSNERTIRKYLKVLNPDKKQLAKLNKFRVLAEMPELVF